MPKYTYEGWQTYRKSEWFVRTVVDSDTGRIDIYISARPGKYPNEYPHFHYFVPDALGRGEIATWSVGKGRSGHQDLSGMEPWMQDFVVHAFTNMPEFSGENFSIANLQRNIARSQDYDQSLWNDAVEQSRALQELWKAGNISKSRYHEIRHELDDAFERLKQMRETQNREAETNYHSLNSLIAKALRNAETATDTRPVHEELRRIQAQIKQTRPLQKQHRDNLFQQVQLGFDTLTRRRREYEQEQARNYQALASTVDAAVRNAENATDTRSAFDNLRKVQQQISQTKVLAKKDRDQLRQRIQSGFDILNRRKREHIESQKRNYQSLRSTVDNALREAEHSQDTRAAFDILKKAQAQISQAKVLDRKDRDELRQRIQSGFDALNRRRKEREQKQADNYRQLLNDAKRAAYKTSSADLKELRTLSDELKQVQSNIRNTDLNPEQRQEINAAIQQGFDNLTRIRNQRAATQRQNKDNLSPRVRECELEASTTEDFRSARALLVQVSQEIREHDLLREDRESLKKRMDNAFSNLKHRQDQAFRRQREERKQQLYERAGKIRASIERLEESVRNDQSYLSELYNRYDAVRPGRREVEIKMGINEKMNRVRDRISDKNAKIRSMYQSANEIESKARSL